MGQIGDLGRQAGRAEPGAQIIVGGGVFAALENQDAVALTLGIIGPGEDHAGTRESQAHGSLSKLTRLARPR